MPATSASVLDAVTLALDTLIQAAARHDGLFPSILGRDGSALFTCPPAIPGQRDCDRSFPGSNLMHDHVVLRLLCDLDAHCPGHGFAAAAGHYLDRFAGHCTTLPNGLFPWGEHLFWNLEEDRVGSSYALARVATMATHDHLLQAPLWLWEALWSRNRAAVERFAVGLEGHFLDVAGAPEYNRHASALVPYTKRTRGPRSCDFPRHSGFFACDWAFALRQSGSPRFAANLRRAMDYWWDRRPPGGALPLETRTSGRRETVASQTMSLGVSLLEVADLLRHGHPELAAEAGRRGGSYVDAFLALPHQPDVGRFVNTIGLDDGLVHGHLANWGSSYGDGVLSATYALLALRASRLAPRDGLEAFAAAVADRLAADVPEALARPDLPVRDAGQYLSLLCELHACTGEARWLRLWERDAPLIAAAYLDAPLPRLATGGAHYESQQLPGHLLRGLARGRLLCTAGIDIGGDFTLR